MSATTIDSPARISKMIADHNRMIELRVTFLFSAMFLFGSFVYLWFIFIESEAFTFMFKLGLVLGSLIVFVAGGWWSFAATKEILASTRRLVAKNMKHGIRMIYQESKRKFLLLIYHGVVMLLLPLLPGILVNMCIFTQSPLLSNIAVILYAWVAVGFSVVIGISLGYYSFFGSSPKLIESESVATAA